VVAVDLSEVIEFCRRLSAQTKEKEAGRVYRLPTEAEWEYACRAGTTTQYSFGDDESRLGEFAWWSGNSNRSLCAVGLKKPNPWGLYDMHGNVWERVSDGYQAYPGKAVKDPIGPSRDRSLVRRGGGWNNTASNCRSSIRNANAESYVSDILGFRLALSPSDESAPEAERK
jgi:formylglycine-generating enzyme required for sulfatase activity